MRERRRRLLTELPEYPEIDLAATGENMRRLREQSGCSVEVMAHYLRLAGPRSIYYWFRGDALPSVDSLYAMSRLFQVSINEILVEKTA